ncbi:hypothetical protein LCGC14_1950800, partial [marine sediment metagenome]
RKVDNGFSMDLKLAVASRQASRIAELTGSFKLLVGGKVTEVVVKDVGALVGKTVSNAQLKSAGLTVKIVKPTGGFFGGGDATKSIAFVVEGPAEMLLGVEMVDEAGKVVKTSGGWSRMGGGPKIRTLTVRGAMPAKSGLKIKLLAGGKTATVAISLKDIPLP